MKVIQSLISLLAIVFVGCEAAVNITQPTILVSEQNPMVYEPFLITVEEYADVDGVRYFPEYFQWIIRTENNEIVNVELPDSSSVEWAPNNAGYYIVSVKIGYDKNKSITAIKDVMVYESLQSLKENIAGHWIGTGKREDDFAEWGIDLTIEDNLHYSGKATYFDFYPNCALDVFNIENLSYLKLYPGGGWSFDSCGVIGDLSGRRFEFLQMDDLKASGNVWIYSVRLFSDGTGDTACWSINFKNMFLDGNHLEFDLPQFNTYPEKRSKISLERKD